MLKVVTVLGLLALVAFPVVRSDANSGNTANDNKGNNNGNNNRNNNGNSIVYTVRSA